MIVRLDTHRLQTLDQVREFLDGSEQVDLQPQTRADSYAFVAKTVRRFDYALRGKADKGLLRRFLAKVAGLSRAQITRLLQQHRTTGEIADRRDTPRRPFPRRYSNADIGLLAELDVLHGTLSGWSCPSSVDTYPLGEEEESTMPKSRPPYPAAFRQQMVELVRSGRTPGELAREFEPSAEAIRNWVAQADRDAGKRSDGLRTEEHEEIRRLRRENRQLREEREILAKATAWFARETGPGRSTGS